ncbi:MAG: ATP-NAD kinase family protein [Promethearchaeota archaeon]
MEFKIGFVVNPIAGMGGSVGLKGTDGEAILEKALQLGAKPVSGERAKEFIHNLKPASSRIGIVTPEGDMGVRWFEDAGWNIETWHAPPRSSARSTPGDTVAFIRDIKESVDLIVFVGGDGTARNVLDGMKSGVESIVPVIGVPAGVKIHSSIFGINPRDAAMLTLKFFSGELGTTEGEVMDIDEDAFRHNRVQSRLYGYLNVPYEPAFLQGMKVGSPATISDEENKQRIATYLLKHIESADILYIIGPGSTTKPIFDALGLEKTLLGVDAIRGGKLAGRDLNAMQIMDLIKSQERESDSNGVKLVVTVIGSQGFVFGRGNLQFTPEVIRAIGLENIIIIMTRHKLASLPNGKLRNDTRDPQLDEEMRGYYRVLVDAGEYKIIAIE